jgi:lipopolysaccharide export system permease protein
MRILNRYLFKAIVGSSILVLAVFLAIGSFVEFLSQMDDVGYGDYGILDAIVYVLFKLPRIALGLLPATVLLGALLGLGALATSSELIVMQTAGVSFTRLARSVATTGIIIAIVGGAISEFVAPQMDLYARQMRTALKHRGADLAGESIWLRTGDSVFNIRTAEKGFGSGQIFVYRFGEPGRLIGMGNARAGQDLDGEWTLKDYRESSFRGERLNIINEFSMEQFADLKDLLATTDLRESSLTGRELWAYIDYLKDNGLDSSRYEIAFWSRISSLVGIALMCVLALPFVSSSLRTAGAGARMLVGVLVGVGYFLLSRTLADSAAVFGLSPLLVAWAPTLILAGVVVIALNRAR